MTLDTTSATQACFETNPHWWGIAALGLSFKFKYLCDSVNGSNNVELSALLSNDLDWSNNFLPGINTLKVIGGDSFLQTYYPKAPYMLSANTAWLEPNTSKAPMNNVNFRKALAYGINPRGSRERRLQRHREGGQPDRANAQPGQLHQLQRGQAVRLQLQPDAGQAVPGKVGLQGPKAHPRGP